MNGNVLERVKNLVALSGSPNLEEARNAAHKACLLIREHKLEFAFPAGHPSQPPKRTVDDDGNEVDFGSYEDDGFFSTIRQGLDFIDKLSGQGTKAVPFDPFTAPFRVVADYARARGIELVDRGQGRYAAKIDGKLVVGGWSEIVRAVFTKLEQ